MHLAKLDDLDDYKLLNCNSNSLSINLDASNSGTVPIVRTKCTELRATYCLAQQFNFTDK